MTDPAFDRRTTPLAEVRKAVAAWEGALAAYRHSPNATTASTAGQRLAQLDWRLDQLWEAMSPEQRAEADGRPIRILAAA